MRTFLIERSNGTYYARWDPIGPFFASRPQARRFRTKRAALAEMRRRAHWLFNFCAIIRYWPGYEKRKAI